MHEQGRHQETNHHAHRHIQKALQCLDLLDRMWVNMLQSALHEL